MKYLITVLFFSYLSLNVAANSQSSFSCKSNRFLKSSFIISLPLSNDGLVALLQSDSNEQACSLEIAEDSDGALLMTPLDSPGNNCSLVNWSRPQTERFLKRVIVSPNFVEDGGGYLKISLDNSMAEYGPSLLTSFVYCRSTL